MKTNNKHTPKKARRVRLMGRLVLSTLPMQLLASMAGDPCDIIVI